MSLTKDLKITIIYCVRAKKWGPLILFLFNIQEKLHKKFDIFKYKSSFINNKQKNVQRVSFLTRTPYTNITDYYRVILIIIVQIIQC